MQGPDQIECCQARTCGGNPLRLGKRLALNQIDSYSGPITNYQITVHEIELRYLVGEEQFVIKCLMYFNGIAFQFNTLIDCGANGYAFIDQKKAKEL